MDFVLHRRRRNLGQGHGDGEEFTVRGERGLESVLVGPGDLFAESGFILGTGRTADVFVVADNTRILSLSNRALRSFMTDHAESGTKILTNLTQILASRLADAENFTG